MIDVETERYAPKGLQNTSGLYGNYSMSSINLTRLFIRISFAQSILSLISHRFFCTDGKRLLK